MIKKKPDKNEQHKVEQYKKTQHPVELMPRKIVYDFYGFVSFCQNAKLRASVADLRLDPVRLFFVDRKNHPDPAVEGIQHFIRRIIQPIL